MMESKGEHIYLSSETRTSLYDLSARLTVSGSPGGDKVKLDEVVTLLEDAKIIIKRAGNMHDEMVRILGNMAIICSAIIDQKEDGKDRSAWILKQAIRYHDEARAMSEVSRWLREKNKGR